MTDQDYIYQTHFTIRSYEVGVNQKTTISTIADLFQEAAGLHAKKLNFDITDLHDLGLTWVLYKMHIRVLRFPERWDRVLVKTWPSTGKDIRAFRSYEMKDENNQLIAKALGQWMTLDVENRRPRKIPDQLSHFPMLNQSGVELNSDRKYIAPANGKDPEMVTTVGKYDLDMNNHVNSVKYIEWSTGYHIKEPHLQCRDLIIQHQGEAHYGDEIYRLAVDFENQQKITLFNSAGDALSTVITSFV